MKQNQLIHDPHLNCYFATTRGMAAPTAETIDSASVYRPLQAAAICDNYYGKGRWTHVVIRTVTRKERLMWASHLGGIKKSVAKTIAVRANAKLPRVRKARLLK